MIEKKSPEVWDILEEVTKGQLPMLLEDGPGRASRLKLKTTRS